MRAFASLVPVFLCECEFISHAIISHKEGGGAWEEATYPFALLVYYLDSSYAIDYICSDALVVLNVQLKLSACSGADEQHNNDCYMYIHCMCTLYTGQANDDVYVYTIICIIYIRILYIL